MAPTAFLLLLISLPALILCAPQDSPPEVQETSPPKEEILPTIQSADTNNVNVIDRNRVFQVSALHDTANWYRASQHCRALGKHLASIFNDEDNDKITSFMKRHQIDKLWLGLNDLAEPGRWTWVASGLPANYTSWETSAGQPNGGEHCVSMVKGGDWHDYGCHHQIRFICE